MEEGTPEGSLCVSVRVCPSVHPVPPRSASCPMALACQLFQWGFTPGSLLVPFHPLPVSCAPCSCLCSVHSSWCSRAIITPPVPPPLPAHLAWGSTQFNLSFENTRSWPIHPQTGQLGEEATREIQVPFFLFIGEVGRGSSKQPFAPTEGAAPWWRALQFAASGPRRLFPSLACEFSLSHFQLRLRPSCCQPTIWSMRDPSCLGQKAQPPTRVRVELGTAARLERPRTAS